MAKRSSGPLNSLSIAELNKEIGRRRRALPALKRRRDKAQAKVDRLNAAIASLGGSGGAGSRGSRGSGGGAVKEGSLVDYLTRALTGATMGVSEVAEAVQKLGYTTGSPNFRTIVNAALTSKKNGFKRVARGKYTAG